jgi:hypothetical protein
MPLPVVEVMLSNPHLVTILTATEAYQFCVVFRKVGLTFSHLLHCWVTGFLGQP